MLAVIISYVAYMMFTALGTGSLAMFVDRPSRTVIKFLIAVVLSFWIAPLLIAVLFLMMAYSMPLSTIAGAVSP